MSYGTRTLKKNVHIVTEISSPKIKIKSVDEKMLNVGEAPLIFKTQNATVLLRDVVTV